MKIEIDSWDCLFVDGRNKYCMYDGNVYCRSVCAQFLVDLDIEYAHIHICHHKTWRCEIKDFTDNRVKVSNA